MSRRSRKTWRELHAVQVGLSLIELLVAMTIGGILIFGAAKVYVDSRKTYELNETTARLQETARYALSIVEADIRMSNYWGLVKGAGVLTGTARQSEASAGAPTSCGVNFARDLLTNLEADNNSYGFTCTAYGAGAVGSADTLVVRRAAVATAAAGAGRLQICSTRVSGELVTDSSGCTAAPEGRINNLIVNAYYVSRDSVDAVGIPALRRHTLIAGPAFRDDEIIPGIEDMQVQFGIDPTGVNGSAARYVNPNEVNDGEQIVSVRIWLLVRADTEEVGFEDGRIYSYGDRVSNDTTNNLSDAAAATRRYAPADGFRRLLVSRTIQIRNALGT